MRKKKSPIRWYRDSQGQWRWRVVGRNGRIVAASSEAFTRKYDAKRNLWRLLELGTEHAYK